MLKDAENLEKIIGFLFQVNKLKQTYRYSTATKFKGDSTADHCWRLSLMVILFAKELKLKINKFKAVKIALIHDLAESVTGDIDFTLIKKGLVSKKDKEKKEREVMQKFRDELPKDVGQEIFNIWEDYETTKTPEAAFVKTLDKIETQLHVLPIIEKLDETDTIFCYADPHAKKFSELKPLVKIIKEKFKREFEKYGKL